MSTLGEQLGLDAMLAADEAASADWKAAWDAAIAQLASRPGGFTTDDVRAIAGAPSDHPNAAGARIRAAANSGLIRKVGYRASTRPELHAHPLAVWSGTRHPEEI
jgi:hypothetical protein